MKNALFSLVLMLVAPMFLNAQLNAHLSDYELAPVYEHIASCHGVAKGRIVGMEIYWNQEHTLCYYHYTLEVEQAIKGKLPHSIVVIQEVVSTPTEMEHNAAYAHPIGSELVAFFDRIPKDWECGYTPRHAYASVFNYELKASLQAVGFIN